MSVLLLPPGEGFLEIRLLSCPGALRTSAFCLETENKNGISYKTNSCVKCFTVYRALSHGFMKIRKESNSWKTDKGVRLKAYLIFKVEKTSEGRGEKAGWSRHEILTQCALFLPPAAVYFESSEYIFLLNAQVLTGVGGRGGGQCGSLLVRLLMFSLWAGDSLEERPCFFSPW